jgi:hypothetical protein
MQAIHLRHAHLRQLVVDRHMVAAIERLSRQESMVALISRCRVEFKALKEKIGYPRQKLNENLVNR